MSAVVTPEWVKDAVFYQIFPDRFAKSEAVPKPANLEAWDAPPTAQGFKGGDLRGVLEHLDYLEALGINAIYLNPVFQSASNHRYHTHDYYQVDPILGGNAALRALLDAAHARGIRVVLDGVFNHASRGFFQFNHLLECGPASPYVDWFIVKGWPLNAYDPKAKEPNYAAWWNLPALPKLNTDTPAVRAFLLDVAEHWIRFGADGWRLDVPSEIDDDAFWQAFRRRVKATNPEAYIVGEVWHDAHRWLQGDQFDAQMNYIFARTAIGFFGAETLSGLKHGPYKIEKLNAPAFAKTLQRTVALYDWQVVLAQLNLLGSHDTARFLSMVAGDVSALRLATLCMMTLPGAPCIYYGDELGLEGGPDPGCRNAIPPDRLNGNRGDPWAFIQAAVALRRAHPALRRGTFEVVYAEGNVIAYRRAFEGAHALVVLNAGREDAAVTLPAGGLHGAAFGTPQALTLSERETQITVPARSGVVLT
ncbi:MAG: glycoside hydrolase family 13 protein [Anaerolineae bacterium]|nr:glycoside hydrolase family 13 protein [Anaerolineae bacterium]